jgi:hypothetical protein
VSHCLITVSNAGGGVTASPDVGWLVPRRDLASTALVLLEQERLKIAEALELSGTLREELLAFKAKPLAKPDDVDAWRERPHDDLVLAVAMSVWAAERFLAKSEDVPAGGSRAPAKPIAAG